MKHATPEFALSCLKDYLTPSKNGRKNSAYKVSVETHLTPSTISNYMNGRSKPSGKSLEILSYYFRLEDYGRYLEENMVNEETGELNDYIPFIEWIEERHVRPLPEIVDPRTGIVKTFIPKEEPTTEGTEKSPDSMKQPNPLSTAPYEYMKGELNEENLLEAMNKELDSLYTTVAAQRERIKMQDRYIAALKAAKDQK